MQLYRTTKGIVLKYKHEAFILNEDWDQLINRNNLFDHLTRRILDEKK